MKPKSKEVIKRLRITELFRQIFVVVISVTISVMVSQWILRRNHHSNVKECLSLVRNELASNRSVADSIAIIYRCHDAGYRFLRKNMQDIRQVDRDSVRFYVRQAFYVSEYKMSEYALEVLKSSANYEELDNQLLIYLNNAYVMCRVYMNTHDNYFAETKAMLNARYADNIYKSVKIDEYEMYDALEKIDGFRSRLHRTNPMGNKLSNAVAISEELGICINAIDSLIACEGYKNYISEDGKD